MKIFGTDSTTRGCFVAFTTGVSEGRGTILELRDEADNALKLPEDSFSFPLLVTSVNLAQSERVFFLRCFNQRIYTYTFGAEIGQITIDFMGFLISGVENAGGAAGDGEAGGALSGIADRVLGRYSKSRVSRSRKFATLSFAGISTLRGLVTSMSSSTANTETNIQKFSITLTTVEVQGPESPIIAPGEDAAGGFGGEAGAPGEPGTAAASDGATITVKPPPTSGVLVSGGISLDSPCGTDDVECWEAMEAAGKVPYGEGAPGTVEGG
jgi:hypothetical protein